MNQKKRVKKVKANKVKKVLKLNQIKINQMINPNQKIQMKKKKLIKVELIKNN
jgi:hypothetical protein